MRCRFNSEEQGKFRQLRGFWLRKYRARLQDHWTGVVRALMVVVLLGGAQSAIEVTVPCSAAAAAGEKDLNFTVVDYNKVLKGPDNRHCWLVQKPGEWKWIGNEYSQDGKILPLPVGTDFNKHTLLVIDFGLATNAVHLNVDRVFKYKEGLVAELAVRTPGNGVPVGGPAHRLLQVVKCEKAPGPLLVHVKYQEYDSSGFIRDKPGNPPSRETLMRGTTPPQKEGDSAKPAEPSPQNSAPPG